LLNFSATGQFFQENYEALAMPVTLDTSIPLMLSNDYCLKILAIKEIGTIIRILVKKRFLLSQVLDVLLPRTEAHGT
jgi:hypothetical protein